MSPFLYGLIGAVIGGIALVLGGFFLLKFLLRRFLGKIVDQLKKFGGGVPPFRITLSEQAEPEWSDAEQVDAIAEQFIKLGYTLVGDYSIDEMFGVVLRALVDESNDFYAIIYEYPEVGLVVDCACDLVEGLHLNATTATESGLDAPDYAQSFRYTLDLKEASASVSELHGRLVAEVANRKTYPASAEEFTSLFADHHAREMDWRIERGGVSAEEVCRVAEIQGQDPPEDEAVEMVQQQWKAAISDFMDEKIRERFLRHVTKMSASQWEDVRDRLFIVHEQSTKTSLVEQLAGHVYDSTSDEDAADEQYEEMETKLTEHFNGQPAREAFSGAQEMIAEPQRYRRLARITGPWPADVYLGPETECD